MRLVAIPAKPGGFNGSREHRLSQRQPRQGDRVESAEGMERIALETGSFHCGIDKTQIKKGVVSNQDGSVATCRFYGFMNRRENVF